MSTISSNDDPRAAVDGAVDLTEAVLDSMLSKISHPQSKDIPALDGPNGLVQNVPKSQQLAAAELDKTEKELADIDRRVSEGLDYLSKDPHTVELKTKAAELRKTLVVKTENQAPKLSDSELVPAILAKIPEDIRDKVTIQVGSFKVHKPGENIKITEGQANALRNMRDDPSKIKGVVKILDEAGDARLLVTGGQVRNDDFELTPKIAPELPTESIAVAPEAPSVSPEKTESIAVAPEIVDSPKIAPELPEVAQATQSVENAIAPGADQQSLIEVISRLENRVAQLEQKIAQKPMKLVNLNIGNWINGIRDNIAAQLHQTTDKLAHRVHEVADKISVTATEKVNDIKEAVTDKVDDIKQNAAETVSDIRENVTDGLDFARDLTLNTVHEVIDAGMERHNEAIAKINDIASDVTNGVKQAIDNPSQSFMEKTVNPVVQRMFAASEKIPNRVTTDDQGNKNLSVGTHQYQLSPSGETSVFRAGEKVTADNLNKSDVAAIQEIKQVFPAPKQAEQIKQTQKVEPPKMKVSV
jgi:hypothetical protein